jgi:hypothetical protein
MATPLDPASFAQAIMLEAADIPPHMTIAQYRTQRPRGSSGRRWRRHMNSARRHFLPRPAAPYAVRPLRYDV